MHRRDAAAPSLELRPANGHTDAEGGRTAPTPQPCDLRQCCWTTQWIRPGTRRFHLFSFRFTRLAGSKDERGRLARCRSCRASRSQALRPFRVREPRREAVSCVTISCLTPLPADHTSPSKSCSRRVSLETPRVGIAWLWINAKRGRRNKNTSPVFPRAILL